MKKLDIAIFHLAFVYSGGGEKLVLKEAEGLKKLGHKVTIYTCCFDKQKCFPDLIKKQNIKDFLPWTKYLLKNHESFQVLLSALFAPFYVHNFKKHDVILAANQPSLWIAYVAKIMYRKKYVGYLAQPTRFLYPRKIDKETGLYFVKKESTSFSVKLMKIFNSLINKLDRLSIKSTDTLLVNGEYMTARINKLYKVKALNCPAGSSYVNTPIKPTFKMRKPYILMTNRHAWQKRFEYGITTLLGVLVKHPDFNLIISGSYTEYTNELVVEINRLGLNTKVIFTDLLNEEELNKLYKMATVYLYTAPEEDYGMGIIEAMGNGVPVVAWDKGGPGKTVINGVTGYLIKTNSTDDFTNKTIKIIENDKLQYKMGKEGVLRVKKYYSWKNHFNILEESLNNLLH